MKLMSLFKNTYFYFYMTWSSRHCFMIKSILYGWWLFLLWLICVSVYLIFDQNALKGGGGSCPVLSFKLKLCHQSQPNPQSHMDVCAEFLGRCPLVAVDLWTVQPASALLFQQSHLPVQGLARAISRHTWKYDHHWSFDKCQLKAQWENESSLSPYNLHKN